MWDIHLEFVWLNNLQFQVNLSRIGVSYYDSSVRQLYVLEVWEDGSVDFPLIDMGMGSCPFVREWFQFCMVSRIWHCFSPPYSFLSISSFSVFTVMSLMQYP